MENILLWQQLPEKIIPASEINSRRKILFLFNCFVGAKNCLKKQNSKSLNEIQIILISH